MATLPKRHSSRLILIATCILASTVLTGDERQLPPWLRKAIETSHPFSITEVTLHGKLAYDFETGEERDELFDQDGKWLCRREGYSATVTAGSCPGRVIFIRVIFPIGLDSASSEPPWGLY